MAWAGFASASARASLCMLQQALLTVYDLGGTLQHVPLPAGVTGMHAVPGALLLTVGTPSPLYIFCSAVPCFLKGLHSGMELSRWGLPQCL